MLNKDEKTVYHVIFRTALDGFSFGDIEKEEFVKIVKQIHSVFFSDIIGFCILDNHFHLLVKIHPGRDFTDQEIKDRFLKLYGDQTELMEDTDKIEYYREKWSNLSELIKEFKQRFLKFYNKLHNRGGHSGESVSKA